MIHELDESIRQISEAAAARRTDQVWLDVKSLLQSESPILFETYAELIQFTSRRILARLEEQQYSPEVWDTYVQFALDAIASFGTADMRYFIKILERLYESVFAFPVAPLPLLKAYMSCIVARRAQQESEMRRASSTAAADASDASEMGKSGPPSLEYSGTAVACAEPLSPPLVQKILDQLPSQLTFAHTKAIVQMQLKNPLPIPGSLFVVPGYFCDTCHLGGIRVGYQAMLYDNETTESTAAGSVRSSARIRSQNRFGFDVCIACAVEFYAQQQTALHSLLTSPHRPFHFGEAAGVELQSAVYQWQRQTHLTCIDARHHLQHASSIGNSPPFLSLAGSLSAIHGTSSPSRAATTTASTTTAGEGRLSVVAKKDPASNGSSSCTSGATSPLRSPLLAISSSSTAAASAAAAEVVKTVPKRLPRQILRRPPSRLPISPDVAPNAPLTRCIGGGQRRGVVVLQVTIAPYGARPIAWVMNEREKHLSIQEAETMMLERLGPQSSWRSGVGIRGTSLWELQGSSSSGTFSPQQSCCLRSPELSVESSCGSGVVESASSPDKSSTNHSSSSGLSATDACTICLCPFDTELPAIRTTCGHWFHVRCMEDYVRVAADVCPLCRAPNALPEMSRSAALQRNKYQLTLHLTEEQSLKPHVDICVGAVITRDGYYRNATSIAAARLVRMAPLQRLSFENTVA